MNKKRITSLFIVLFFLITTVSFVVLADKEREYRAAFTYKSIGISTNSYCSNNDLNTLDADIFHEKMGSTPGALKKNEGYPPEVTSCDEMTTGGPFDYVYFAGHGSPGKFYICDYSDSANPVDLTCGPASLIARAGQPRNVIFASCETVDAANTWKSCFTGYNGTLKSILGYYESVADSDTHSVAPEIANRIIALNDPSKGEKHVKAWYLSNQVLDSTSKIWSAIAYREYDKKLTFWSKTYTEVKPHPWNGGPIRDFNPSLNLMNGRILVYDNLERSAPESMCEWETSSENLDSKNFEIFKSERFSKGITSYKSGGMVFEQDEEPYRGEEISSSEALGIAERFVSQNGGLPDSFFLSEIAEIECKDIETGVRSTDGHSFVWRQMVEGNVVAGGNAIKVTVKNGTVIQYYRKVTNPDKKVNTERVKLLTKEDALRIAANEIIQSVRTLSPLSITAVDTIYYSENIYRDDKRLIPAYILIFQGGAKMFVDARTGALLW